MSNLNIKPTHKPIKTYYAELEKYTQLGEENEGTVRAAFQNLLQHCCHQSDFTLLCEKTRSARSDNTGSSQTALNRRIRSDGAVVNAFGLPHGYWEAKDTQDDLHIEASKKFTVGYRSKNIVVQSPTLVLLYKVCVPPCASSNPRVMPCVSRLASCVTSSSLLTCVADWRASSPKLSIAQPAAIDPCCV